MTNSQIPYIIYSNTDYLNILKIQSDYIQTYQNKILFINHNPDLNLENIYNKYNKVIFYNNDSPYATRVLECLSQLDSDYILFIHDIDILISANEDILSIIIVIMKSLKIDRIDLKHTPPNSDNIMCIMNKIFMVKQNNPNFYIYNVNPSIWNRNSFMELLSNFKHKGYRNIEDMDVQMFSLKYNIYKLYTKSYLKCGYYNCTEFFKFLHISHAGKMLPWNNQYITEYGQSYIDIKDDFWNILNTYIR